MIEADLRERRIPTRLVVLGALGLIASSTISVFDDDGGRRITCGVVGAILLGLVFLMVHFVSPGGLGFGDVRLAAVLGGVVGNATATFTAPGYAALLASVATVVAMAVLRRRTLPFGPFLVGAALVIIAADLIVG